MSTVKLESILLVVDNWELQERYEEKLSSHFEVTCVPFAQTGLEILVQSQDRFRHLVVDLSVESMTHLEFLDELRKLPAFENTKIWVIDDENPAGALKNRLKENDQILIRPIRLDSLLDLFRKQA